MRIFTGLFSHNASAEASAFLPPAHPTPPKNRPPRRRTCPGLPARVPGNVRPPLPLEEGRGKGDPDRGFAGILMLPHTVMAAHAGIHDFLSSLPPAAPHPGRGMNGRTPAKASV